MTTEGFIFLMGCLAGFILGILIVAASEMVPRLYRTIEPYLNEVIEIKKKRLRDRYDEEKAVSKTARGD